jgi:hypothetical protein
MEIDLIPGEMVMSEFLWVDDELLDLCHDYLDAENEDNYDSCS